MVDVAYRLDMRHGWGDYLAWEATNTTNSDLRLAVLALGFMMVFICLHTRSLLLGSLGAVQIGLSFPVHRLGLNLMSHTFPSEGGP